MERLGGWSKFHVSEKERGRKKEGMWGPIICKFYGHNKHNKQTFPYRYTKMNSATYIYIFNLALADFLVLATLPFQGTDVLLDFWPFGLSLCKIVVSIDYYNMFTSVFTLTVMSVDRYIAVCHPVRSLAVRTTSKAKVVNVGVWVLASAIGVPVMVMGQLEVEPNGRCFFLYFLNLLQDK